MIMSEKTISKLLSANDTGETGGHQAGLLIPRERHALSFFPNLNDNQRNPRAHLSFEDESGCFWEFAFIYYNNKLFGGTRNEYRLTRMTRYIRNANLTTGDEIIMNRHPNGDYAISYRRKDESVAIHSTERRTVLKLGSGWKIINI